jgi:hypothetical protein
MFINDLLTEDIHYIFSPLSLYNNEWRWDDSKFLALPKDKLIIVNCSSENWGMGEFIGSLYNNLERYHLNFLILSHNPDDHLTRPNLLFYPYWYQDSVKFFNQPIFSNLKTYKLSCLNGNPRPHRIVNYFKLLEKNYADTFISMHSTENSITNRDDDCVLDQITLQKWAEISVQFKNRNTSTCSQGPDNEAYLDTYVNLVTETTVSDRLFITEKTWKPIASGQLFLVLGNPGTIKFLREQGVDTFDDYIDHSYDNETDFTVRLDKLYQSLDQLMLSNLEDLYKQTQHRRLENTNRFFAGTFDLRYAKTLKECINTQN